MHISLQMILNKIKYVEPKLYIKDTSTPMTSIKLLTSRQTTFEPDILYIGDIQRIDFKPANDIPRNLICRSEESISLFLINDPKCNLIVVKNSTDLYTLFNTLQDLFIKNEKYRSGRVKLSELFLGNCDIQEILDCAFEIIQNPICLSDTTNSVMAYTQNISIEDPTWDEMIEKKFLPDRCFYTLKNKRLIEKVNMEHTPVITPLPYSKYRNIMHNIVIDDKILAQMGIVESMRPFEDQDLDFISFLCKIIGAKLEKNKLAHNTKKIMLENFLIQLIEGKITDPLIIEENCKHFHLCIDKRIVVLTIFIDEFERNNTNLDYCRDQIEKILQNTNSLIYDGHIVFILTIDAQSFLTESTITKLKRFLKSNKMSAGFSFRFNNLKDLHKYYQQSISSVESGSMINKEKYIYEYNDYAVYDLLKDFPKEKLRDYCHPSVLLLIKYDHQKNTAFSKTLYKYLENSRNATNTAISLKIHRNSLTYRLEKLCEIMDLSLDNNNELFYIHLSFKILELLRETVFD